jgi:hypothetical protein
MNEATADPLAMKVGGQGVLVPYLLTKSFELRQSTYSLILGCENAGVLLPYCSSTDGLQLTAHMFILGRAHQSPPDLLFIQRDSAPRVVNTILRQRVRRDCASS